MKKKKRSSRKLRRKNPQKCRKNPVSCPSCGTGNKDGRDTCWKCNFELISSARPHFGGAHRGRTLRAPKKRQKRQKRQKRRHLKRQKKKA